MRSGRITVVIQPGPRSPPSGIDATTGARRDGGRRGQVVSPSTVTPIGSDGLRNFAAMSNPAPSEVPPTRATELPTDGPATSYATVSHEMTVTRSKPGKILSVAKSQMDRLRWCWPVDPSRALPRVVGITRAEQYQGHNHCHSNPGLLLADRRASFEVIAEELVEASVRIEYHNTGCRHGPCNSAEPYI